MVNRNDNPNQGETGSPSGIYSTQSMNQVPFSNPQQTVPPMAVPPASGDIIIGETKAQKSGKPFLIGGVVVLFLIILFGTVSLILFAVSSQGDVKSSFTKFANFLLFGEDSGENISLRPYDPDTQYSLSERFEARDREYFSTLEGLYGIFGEKYAKDKSGFDAYAIGEIDSYNHSFEILKVISSVDRMDEEEILSRYLDSGSDGALKSIEEGVREIREFSEQGEAYASYVLEYAEGVLRELSAYDADDCLSDGEIVYDCAYKSAPFNGYEENEAKKSKAENAIQMMESYLLNDLIKRSWTVSSLLEAADE